MLHEALPNGASIALTPYVFRQVYNESLYLAIAKRLILVTRKHARTSSSIDVEDVPALYPLTAAAPAPRLALHSLLGSRSTHHDVLYELPYSSKRYVCLFRPILMLLTPSLLRFGA